LDLQAKFTGVLKQTSVTPEYALHPILTSTKKSALWMAVSPSKNFWNAGDNLSYASYALGDQD
jgi:hypothetical protein